MLVRMGDAPQNSLVPFTMNNEVWKRLNAVMGPTSAVIPRLSMAPRAGMSRASTAAFDIRGRLIPRTVRTGLSRRSATGMQASNRGLVCVY